MSGTTICTECGCDAYSYPRFGFDACNTPGCTQNYTTKRSKLGPPPAAPTKDELEFNVSTSTLAKRENGC